MKPLPSRIAAGFHRIGLALSIPVALVGLGFCIMASLQTRDGGSFFAIGIAIALLAIPLYAASWAIGWVVRGFMGEAGIVPRPASLGAAEAPAPAQVPAAEPRWVKRAPPTGFRGWLLLPALGTIIAPFVAAKGAIDLAEVVTKAADRSHPVFLYLYGGIALNCAMVGLDAWALVLMVQRDRRYPKVFIAALAAGAVLVTADAILAQVLFNVAIDQEASKLIGRSVGAAAIWIPYMLMSKRVTGTFVN